MSSRHHSCADPYSRRMTRGNIAWKFLYAPKHYPRLNESHDRLTVLPSGSGSSVCDWDHRMKITVCCCAERKHPKPLPPSLGYTTNLSRKRTIATQVVGARYSVILLSLLSLVSPPRYHCLPVVSVFCCNSLVQRHGTRRFCNALAAYRI